MQGAYFHFLFLKTERAFCQLFVLLTFSCCFLLSFCLNIMQDENTPLHRASVCGHKEVAELLLKNGATVDARSKVCAFHCEFV